MVYPREIYMSPRKAVQRFIQIMQRCHPRTVFIGRNYREEKEALIAAEFLYGIEKLYGGRYWLQNAEYISKDIDIKVIIVSRDIDKHYGRSAFLQITEFESHNDNFIDVLNLKNKPGYNPGQLELVINVREKSGQIFYPKELAAQVEAARPKYSAVWLLIDDINNEWVFHLIKLYPDFVRTQYNIQELINNASEPDFIREIPKYAKYVKAEKEFNLPLPPCPECGNV